MAVITTRGSLYDLHTGGSNCSVCNDKLQAPFVAWMCTEGPVGDLFFCGTCCRKIKNGLMADMIQVAAIAEINALGDVGSYYSGQTLVRVREDKANVEKVLQEECRANEMLRAEPSTNSKVQSIKRPGAMP